MLKISRISLILIFLISIIGIKISYATHNRAGEIIYKQISKFTYEITIITYTYTPSAADREELDISWGDNTLSQIPRIGIYNMPDDIQRNTYRMRHTFPGAGVYQLTMSDPNRNENIVNIPESVNVVFTLKTILKIDPTIGFNNTPTLLNPPIDKAALNERFVHNPNAYDADGDSLSYKLTECLGANGLPIPGFSYPEASNEIYVNPITGDFVWDSPVQIGEYNVAIEIEEWRDGIKIGSVIRDMQIRVEESDNHPPIIAPLPDFCVTAGENISFTVTATDPDNDNITLSATGGTFLFATNKSEFTTKHGASPVSQTFSWNTSCEHIRQQYYTVLFRAEDDNPEVELTDYNEVNITVVAPAPQNLTTTPSSNTIYLSWDEYSCSNAAGIIIYRKKEPYNFTPANCEVGMPEDAGYQIVDTIKNLGIHEYLDNDNDENGLDPGYNYCYRLMAYFNNGAESYLSNEACAELIKGTPVFIEATVNNTDTENGSIHLKWMNPTEFNSTTYPGPYKYILESKIGLDGDEFQPTAEILGLNDTAYIDTLINSKDNGKYYKLTLYSQAGSSWEQVGTSGYTSSTFLESNSSDKKVIIIANHNTPWTNYNFEVSIKDADDDCTPNTNTYTSIKTSDNKTITVNNLENDKYYWFKVKTTGKFGLDYIPSPLYNLSQEICASPKDTIPPCPVKLKVENLCTLFQNELKWTIADSCTKGLSHFNIYYKDSNDGEFELLEKLEDVDAREYIHIPENTLAACYIVEAVDSTGNFIPYTQLTSVCSDECIYYELPNVFTPDGDGINDIYKPLPYQYVEKIDMKIYNRWGNLVFETQNPDINWKGIDIESGKKVSDGVYYYYCDVYEKRLEGVEVRNLSGFIHVFGNQKNNTPK